MRAQGKARAIVHCIFCTALVIAAGCGGSDHSPPSLYPYGTETSRVSIDSNGIEGNSSSFDASISEDGRFVAFVSVADNLDPWDTNGTSDIFVRDRLLGVTSRVSVDQFGNRVNGNCWDPSISGDGRFVAYGSIAPDVIDNDTNGTQDVFVHDRTTSMVERISVDSAGSQADGMSYDPSLSADGRFIAFSSAATNLVVNDTNDTTDVFVHDRQTGETIRVSVSTSGIQGNSESYNASISDDGRYVAFESSASNLVSGDTFGASDIFVHDRLTGVTMRVSVDSAGAEATGHSHEPSISGDGRFVAFESSAADLVTGDTNGSDDVFVHDIQTAETALVSVSSTGARGDFSSFWPKLSADGRYVVFVSDATNFDPEDTNWTYDIYVRDRLEGITTRVNLGPQNVQGNGENLGIPAISGNGRYAAYESTSSNLVLDDNNNATDIFVSPVLGSFPGAAAPQQAGIRSRQRGEP